MTDPIDWNQLGTEAIDHFKALLRMNTVNPPGNEVVAAKYIEGVLQKEGIECTIVESEPTRASLIARLPGSGKGGGPLLLNGHLDVVAVDRDQWKYDPFGGIEAEGCIWGRGAVDMKNMVTMSMMTLILLKRLNLPLERDVIFAAVADEEAGSNKGALFLAENHPELVRAEYVLNEVGGHTLYFGDSRFYPIQVSEKGICWFELTAKGEPGHGSMPHGNNAVVRIAKAIAALGSVRLPQHNTPVVEGFVRELARRAKFPTNKAMPLLLEKHLSGPLLDVLGKANPDQAMGINAMLRNTVSPTILEGGCKVNVIPSEASVKLDGRIIPGQSKEDFLEEVRRVVGDDLRVTILEHHDGTVFDANTPLYDAICRTLHRHDPAGIPVPYMIPGFTDSFAYGGLGATCYGFSPVRLPPDMNFTRMYHGHNERIPVDGFRWGLQVLAELVMDFVIPEGTKPGASE